MPEMGTSGLMSGEWKRSAWQDTQAPATERAGLSYGLAYTLPRHSSTPQNRPERDCGETRLRIQNNRRAIFANFGAAEKKVTSNLLIYKQDFGEG